MLQFGKVSLTCCQIQLPIYPLVRKVSPKFVYVKIGKLQAGISTVAKSD